MPYRRVNLVELIRIPAEQVQKRVEIVGNAEVVRLRAQLLPLVRLSRPAQSPADLYGPRQ